MRDNIIPIFFASDKNYLHYLAVAAKSLSDKASESNQYKIYVLSDDLRDHDLAIIKSLLRSNVSIEIADVTEKMSSIKNKVSLRDYYTPSIYFRLFIPTMFPQYKKAIYLDVDITLNADIAKMYKEELGDNYIGAVLDETVWSNKDFTYYVNNALDITEKQYFNSGVLLMNLEKFRNNNIEEDFYKWVNDSYGGTVAPDQDYLNCISKNKVKYLDIGWNKMPLGDKLDDDKLYLIHYNMFMKPWKYYNVMFEEYFWNTARETPYYEQLLNQRASYTQAQRDKDSISASNLLKLAVNIANSNTNYRAVVLKKSVPTNNHVMDMMTDTIPQQS